MKKVITCLKFSAAAISAALILGSCFFFSGGSDDNLTSDMVTNLDKSFLQTHTMLQGSSGTAAGMVPRLLSTAPLTPFSTPASGVSGSMMKATITRTGEITGFVGGSIPDYPEPGQTTSFTVTLMNAVDKIYMIKATTSYPSTSPALETIEEYLVKDVSPGDPLSPDGQWNEHDPIVDSTGTTDNSYRTTYYTKFRDNSIRNEKIIMWNTSDPLLLYAAFDINGPLDYPAVYNPPTGTAVYSSIVLYTHVRTNTLNYWFWNGTRYQNTVGIRYYTEQTVNQAVNGQTAVLRGTTLVFEKTLENILTLGGSLADSLADVYAGGTNNALARTVTRQEVFFNASNSAISKTTKSKVAVYDVTGQEAVYITKIGDAAATGNLFVYDAVAAAALNRQTIINNDPYGQPLVATTPPAGDLGTLYAAIVNQAVVSSDNITGTGSAYVFNGQNGIVIPDLAANEYDLTTVGTVEAWVKLNAKAPFAAIVHKGVKDNFTDEVYSLQFWSRGDDPVFVLNPVSGSYILLQASGPNKYLSLNTWYYIVATWNISEVVLYINGTQAARATNTFYPSPPKSGVRVNDAPVVVGAQFATSSVVYRTYYGLNGIIDNWKVKKAYTAAADVLAEYNLYAGN